MMEVPTDESSPEASSENLPNGAKSSFSDPTFQQLSKINGQINKMTRMEIVNHLRSLNLDTRGNKEVIKKRLKAMYKRQALAKTNLANSVNHRHPHYFCIIDFEATCTQQNSSSYKHEIIEFPAILIDVAEKKIVHEFHRFCRPVLNPTLSPFCISLTGITQAEVDDASYFQKVLEEFEEWLSTYKLGKTYSFTVVTDGPWDIDRFLSIQCEISDIPLPKYARKWINVRKTFSTYYKCKRSNLQQMLEYLGLRFEGRPHSGLDDSRNIARIVIHLLKDGAHLKVNEHVTKQHGSDVEDKSQE